MQHDSYFCKKYSGTRAFPVRRKNETNNFVASVVAQKQYIWKKCPEKCRPRDHPDWEYCWNWHGVWLDSKRRISSDSNWTACCKHWSDKQNPDMSSKWLLNPSYKGFLPNSWTSFPEKSVDTSSQIAHRYQKIKNSLLEAFQKRRFWRWNGPTIC